VNVFIGLILICSVLADIWIRQQGIVGAWGKRLGLGRRREA